MRQIFAKLLIAWSVIAVASATSAHAQPRVQIPAGAMQGGQSVPVVPVQPFGGGAAVPSWGAQPGVQLGVPTFDPYAAANSAPSLFGGQPAAPYGSAPSSFGGLFGQPAAPAYNPAFPTQPGFPGVPGYGAAPPAYGGAPSFGSAFPTYPGSVTPNPYPGQAPSALFPNGLNLWGPNSAYTNNQAEPLRLFDNLRLRHTWLAGGEGRELDINDTEVATTLQLPNFLGFGQPLLLSPNFALHLWDGPQPPAVVGLPANAYSAYLEAAMRSDPVKTFGGDITASIGVFSDFNAINTNSIRIQGLGFGWVRLTPTFMLKVGVNYLDRVDVKLLPAVGFLWEPDQLTKFDVFFPKPKISRYMTTLGNADFWIYLAGEYGGGSWTVDRPGFGSDQVDINDIRVIGGVEWMTQPGWKGMFEAGWVTHREVLYRFTAGDQRLRDTFMLRLGVIW